MMDAVMSGGGMAVGAVLMLYSVWCLYRAGNQKSLHARRYQNPRRSLKRRGEICGVGGTGLLAMGLAFWGAPQNWGTTVLLLWMSGVLLTLLLNELMSMHD